MQKRLAEIEALWNDGKIFVFLVKGYVDVGDCAERIQKVLLELTGKTYSCIYQSRSVRINELRETYQFLKTWENDLFYEECGCIKAVEEGMAPEMIRTGEPDGWQKKEFCRRLEECIRSGSEREMGQTLDELCSYYGNRRAERESLLHDIYWLIFKVEEKFPDLAERKKEEIHHQLSGVGSLSELKLLVKSYFGHLAAAYGSGMGGKSSFVVRKVMEYVSKNYARAMTVEEMAQEIHLSSNYIRSIFKEGTGKTVLEYITNYRFEKACELLREPSYKVKEVSNMVGFENVSYFCSVFTKRYGMTPNEFRNKNL